MCNAGFSVLQSSAMKHPKLLKFVNPKFIVYNYYLQIAELDKAKSESLV
jgi:hypothetical protein